MRDAIHDSVDELFAGAIALAVAERSRFLDSRCGRDTALRSRVEELLKYHDEAGSFLEVPPLTVLPVEPMVGAGNVDDGGMPARIGRYRIERVLGVGGMGRVYLGESDQPRRRVALKVVRAGLGSGSALRRFEQEAQVVALLQHPGIAQLYEAGEATEAGGGGSAPYFAMEYVDGPTLTEYARSKGLRIEQRLELFCRVCDAVEHAHVRGIVHRDLKPANILVDPAGQPKILDFGVARIMDPEASGGLAGTTLHTQAGQLIGTLSYMSPEQVSGEPGDVDARSDVYALGVVLYELLSGRLPHDVTKRSIPEAIRAIREDAPTSLSTIDRGYRGDIETIVGKAIEKDASRRYQSAAALAADIRRSLRDEPIVARPPSTWYQLSKFAKRNKVLVAGVAATMLALSAGLVAAVWQAREADAARVDAEQQARAADLARQDAVIASKKAEESLEVSREVNRFLEQLFSSPDPEERMGPEVRVMQVLDRSERHLDLDLHDQPHVRAALHRTIGGTYRSLTEYSKAERHLRAAYEIDRDLYGEAHEETIQSMTLMVLLLTDMNRHPEAHELAKRQWGLTPEVYAADDPERLAIASNYAMTMTEVGMWKEAEELQRMVLRERERIYPAGHPLVLGSMNGLGRTLARTGRLKEAEAIQRRAVDLHRASGEPLSVMTYTVMLGLTNTLLELGKDEEAGVLAEELVEEGAGFFGKDHNAILAARNALGQVLLRRGKFDEAEGVFRELVRLNSESEVPTVDGLVRMKNNLGETLRYQGKLPESEAEFRAAIKLLDDNSFVPDRVRIGLLSNLATVIRLQKRYKEALPVYEELVRVAERVLAPDDVTISICKYGYGVTLLGERRPEECEAQLQGAYDIAMKTFTEKDPPVISIMRSFLNLYELWKKPDKAEYWRAKLPEQYR